MIKNYYRPDTLQEALTLLSAPGETTRALFGYDALPDDTADTVVDLQAVGLNAITTAPGTLTLETQVRLQTLVDTPSVPEWLREIARAEAPNTFRNMRTVGSLLLKPYAESVLLAALLVADAQVMVTSLNGTRTVALSDYLAAPGNGLPTALTLATDGKVAVARVGRTPADTPIVAAVARRGGDGTARLALCGVAALPTLVDPAAVATLQPPGDFRGSTEYRHEMAGVLSTRVLNEVGA
jgi:CO/xanthine dehydrogenase FAD-binding subunit